MDFDLGFVNIEARVWKGLGIVSQIHDILKQIDLGVHYFKTALTLRSALLLNGILTNCKVWYGLCQSEIQKLEVDR